MTFDEISEQAEQLSYRDKLRLHILPSLGAVKLRLLHKGRIKAFLTAKLAEKCHIRGPSSRATRSGSSTPPFA